MGTLARKCLTALLVASILYVQTARGKDEVEELLVRQQRPHTWSESTSDGKGRSEGGRVRQGEYGYNNAPYPPYRPYYQRPYPNTVYPYDDAEDIQYYQQQQPYRPSPPRPYVPPGYYQPPVTPPLVYPPYSQPPLYPSPQQQPYLPYTQPPATTVTANPLAPIGYMLVDTYTSPLRKRAISVPRAFFKVSK